MGAEFWGPGCQEHGLKVGSGKDVDQRWVCSLGPTELSSPHGEGWAGGAQAGPSDVQGPWLIGLREVFIYCIADMFIE